MHLTTFSSCDLPEECLYRLHMAPRPFFLAHITVCETTEVLRSILCVVQFVADGVFYAELNELLTRELAEHGYSGVEVRVTPIKTEIIIRATRTQNVLGEPAGLCCGCLLVYGSRTSADRSAA